MTAQPDRDEVDRIVDAWRRARPDLDVAPLHVFSRITRIARILDLARRRAFARHGIDFCCGGGVPLAQACAKRGLDARTVVAEIETTLAGAGDAGERWNDAPLANRSPTSAGSRSSGAEISAWARVC